MPRLLATVRMGWAGLWLYPATLLPLVLAAPWTHRRLGRLVDRHVLGRRFTPVEAGQHFFSALRGVPNVPDILRVAEAELAEIFQAPARIRLDEQAPPGGDEVAGGVVAPLRADGSRLGAIQVDASRGSRRLLSEDRALLASLAEGLSFLLDNARLQEKKREQEVKARELALQASRSELRALRAQINPHFLFNALNTIAALIPRAPDQAEESVERLAEVFRYALRGSESEWARVEDEMTSVAAYLDLEGTRFAERLEVRLHVGDGAGDALIPAMCVQTLVENAVKHGIAGRRGRGGSRSTCADAATGCGWRCGTPGRASRSSGRWPRPRRPAAAAACATSATGSRATSAVARDDRRARRRRDPRRPDAAVPDRGHGGTEAMTRGCSSTTRARAGSGCGRCWPPSSASRSWARPRTARRRSRGSPACAPTSCSSTCRCPRAAA